jgi:hypothetical protein
MMVDKAFEKFWWILGAREIQEFELVSDVGNPNKIIFLQLSKLSDQQETLKREEDFLLELLGKMQLEHISYNSQTCQSKNQEELFCFNRICHHNDHPIITVHLEFSPFFNVFFIFLCSKALRVSIL